jgi:PIN domain nuclease of toxin-antitoxin system
MAISCPSPFNCNAFAAATGSREHQNGEPKPSTFVILQLNSQIAARAAQLPVSYPRDPMDRIIGATAIVEDLPLVTADAQIQQSKAVKAIW